MFYYKRYNINADYFISVPRSIWKKDLLLSTENGKKIVKCVTLLVAYHTGKVFHGNKNIVIIF